MPDELDLTLPRGKKDQPSTGRRRLPAALAVILLIGIANLVLVWRGSSGRPEPTLTGGFTPASSKDLALKLEKQDLNESAARAWREYLASPGLDDVERAKVWYRVGKLHQESGHYEKALDAFYRSEAVAHVNELSEEISRRSQECLEALGKFAALRYELAERVGSEEGQVRPGDEIVAEIGPQKITKAQLDESIEKQIDLQMAQFGAYLTPEQFKRQKEAVLKRLSSSAERLRMLNQLIVEEVLYRKAREDRLYEDPDVRALLEDAERKILAQAVLQREIAAEVKITEGDLELYYQAHKDEYRQPERAEVSHILVEDEQAAEEVMKRLESGEDFGDLARELSKEKATADAGGEISGEVEKGSPIPGIGRSDEATGLIFSTAAGEVADRPVKTDRGFHVLKVRSREGERQKPFDEVRDEVYRTIRARKEREVQEDLIERLKQRHNVVIHHSQFAADAPDSKAVEHKQQAVKDDD